MRSGFIFLSYCSVGKSTNALIEQNSHLTLWVAGSTGKPKLYLVIHKTCADSMILSAATHKSVPGVHQAPEEIL